MSMRGSHMYGYECSYSCLRVEGVMKEEFTLSFLLSVTPFFHFFYVFFF